MIRLLPGEMPDKKPFRMAAEVVAQAASPGKSEKLARTRRDLLRLKHYTCLRTERCYCDWIERFIRSMESAASRATWASDSLP